MKYQRRSITTTRANVGNYCLISPGKAQNSWMLDVARCICHDAQTRTQLYEAWGWSFDDKAAKVASTRLDRVLHGDATKTLNDLPDNYFDLICMNDVIEHLIWPEEFLKNLRAKLSPDGRISALFPTSANIACSGIFSNIRTSNIPMEVY